jgi:hypothetical protein
LSSTKTKTICDLRLPLPQQFPFIKLYRKLQIPIFCSIFWLVSCEHEAWPWGSFNAFDRNTIISLDKNSFFIYCSSFHQICSPLYYPIHCLPYIYNIFNHSALFNH